MDIDFPYRVGANGRTAVTGVADHVRDMLEQLLFTRPGERVNRPDFGCGLLDLVFEPTSSELAAVVQATTQAAIQRWLGDVLSAEDVEVSSVDSTLTVRIAYRLLATGERREETMAVTP
ncbi:GPW/gp25 family protein [Actinoplanes sp. CA-030573]|uniref:GPW/gp25 family protein n=1 Tax=Actinoplanes sp. CA-030573 TaxID=3239898 RepID=UPI003D8BF21D